MSHTYVIHGLPVPWARPGKSGKRSYDTQKLLKLQWSVSIENQREGQPFYVQTPLIFSANFYFPVPASLKPANKEALIGKPYVAKPDIDNLVALIWDTCNEVLFDDDSRICFIESIGKWYDYDARTEFSLRPYIAKK